MRLGFGFRLSLLCLSSSLHLGCTLSMNYAQCQHDEDCPANGDAKQFCTSDQICVPDTPQERLCAQTEPAMPSADARHIGALLYMPPDNTSPAVKVRLSAMQLAVQQINDLAKTDQARPLALHICDISGSAGDARNSLQVLISKYNVAAVIGPDSQQALSDVVGLAASAAVPIISPAGTASALVQLPSLGYLLRMAPVETQQSSSIAREVPNGALLGVISTEDSYGNNVRRSFLSAWNNRDARNNMLRFSYS
jgi:ABC-type branched-subunit amino acid transport system substrate-binding protein